MSLSEVSDILWRERDLLELLVFKLEEEQLVVDARRLRWLAHASREVEMVREEIREVELLRSVEVASLASGLEIGSDVSLRQLAAAVDEPWRSILVDHRRALLASTREIRKLAEAGLGALEAGAAATGEELGWLGDAEEAPAP
jgi:hypothetical protein